MNFTDRKYKLRITKCWLVEVTDNKGFVQKYKSESGRIKRADDFCFGTKEEAKQLGNKLMKLVNNNDTIN